MATYTGWKAALSAALGKVADTTAAHQITLTAPLALTVPAGFPAGQVYRVTLTQDGTGGHTVTYGGSPVTVTATAGASTLVEFFHDGTDWRPRKPGIDGAFDILPGATKADFIAKATQVAAAGRQALTVAPGTYDVPDITPADISGLYLVGDGVKLVGTPVPNLYPFTSAEWSGLATARAATGGRGMVAFEVDDALPEHWTHLFPLTKELGITVGTAWHTGNGAKWVTEAVRHGWEPIFHLSANIEATTLTEAQLEAECAAGKQIIKDATGRDRVGFVYPQHARSADTDRIFARHFTRGRGLSEARVYPADGTRGKWLVSSYAIDEALDNTLVNKKRLMHEALRAVAASNGRMVMYFHYQNSNRVKYDPALRELVAFIRDLGIDIVNPEVVWGNRVMPTDVYDDDNRWTIYQLAERSTDRAYYGDHSVKISIPSGTAFGSGLIGLPSVYVPPRPGAFSVWRASYRLWTTGATKQTISQGIGWSAALHYRDTAGGIVTKNRAAINAKQPTTSNTIPAANWERFSVPLYLGPAVSRVDFTLSAENIAEGGVLYFDELTVELVDYVTAVTVPVTLAGTANVHAYHGVADIPQHTVIVHPQTPIAGQLTITSTPNRVSVASSNASDVGQVVLITVLPGASYNSMTFPATGA